MATPSARSSMSAAAFGATLSLDEAARMLALSSPPEPKPADLLTPPHETFPGFVSETWRAGDAARRRERQLRAELPSVTRRGGKQNQRWTAQLGSARETVATVTFDYPASDRVPAIEVA